MNQFLPTWWFCELFPELSAKRLVTKNQWDFAFDETSGVWRVCVTGDDKVKWQRAAGRQTRGKHAVGPAGTRQSVLPARPGNGLVWLVWPVMWWVARNINTSILTADQPQSRIQRNSNSTRPPHCWQFQGRRSQAKRPPCLWSLQYPYQLSNLSPHHNNYRFNCKTIEVRWYAFCCVLRVSVLRSYLINLVINHSSNCKATVCGNSELCSRWWRRNNCNAGLPTK